MASVTIMMSGGSIDVGMLLREGSRQTGHPIAQQMAGELMNVLEILAQCREAQSWVLPTLKLFNAAIGNVVLGSLMTQLEFILAFHFEVPIV